MKLLEENLGGKLFGFGFGSGFWKNMTIKSQATREKYKQAKLYKTKRLMHSERNNQKNQKVIHGMWENIWKLIWGPK